MSKKDNRRIKKLTSDMIALLIVLLVILLDIYRCPFKLFLGIPCPGCGMTRALFAAMRLDFAGAFNYHPMFLPVILIGVYIVLEKLNLFRLDSKYKNLIVKIFCVAMLVTYVIRLM